MNRMKKLIFLLLPLLMLCSCAPDTAEKPEPTAQTAVETQTAAITTDFTETTGSTESSEPQNTAEITPGTQPPAEESSLMLTINSTPVTVQWEQNESVTALMELVGNEPLTIRMSMYGGFEQVGPIGQSLPRNDAQTTTQAGDIVLYSGNQIVVFYGSNSWAYTRLGHITDKTPQDLKELLGNGDVTITISMEG